MRFGFLSILMLVGLGAPVQAAWYEASSDHFVIYADDLEPEIRTFAENLERYHAAMQYVTQQSAELPSPSNRVTIFVVGGSKDLLKLTGDRMIAGFYSPRAGASRAFVKDIRNKNGQPDFSMIALTHEYAHHFLLSSTRRTLPRWYVEGMAEFFASAAFKQDGTVELGRPAYHRVGELLFDASVDVEELLDPDFYSENKSKHGAFYGRSWLLYHYLTLSGNRTDQMAAYFNALSRGKSSLDAGREAFGDLDDFQRELNKYLDQKRMNSLRVPPELISSGPIKLRALPEGEAEMMPVRIRSQRGVDRATAADLVSEAREIASRYPEDPGVLTALAEAEYDAGNPDAAIAAADKAIELDPTRPNAYVQKGYALFTKAAKADDGESAYARAMEPFGALNAIENDHPLPLIYYYRSFTWRNKAPSDNAKNALKRASELAPFDKGVTLELALMYAKEGEIAQAQQTLFPLAYDPHGGDLANRALSMIESLESVNEGTSWSPPPSTDLPDSTEEDGRAGEDT